MSRTAEHSQTLGRRRTFWGSWLLLGLGGLGGCADAGELVSRPGSPLDETVDMQDGVLPTAAQEQAIIGGRATTGWPAVGALTYRGRSFCSGTIIGPRKVLTAAHCLVGIRPEEIRFVLGPDATRPWSELPVAELLVHPEYDGIRFLNDVGLVLLARDAPEEPMALLRDMDEVLPGEPLVFVGYGVTNGRRQSGGGIKREVTIPLGELLATQFRYSEEEGGVCSGDSGGPAFYQPEPGRWLIAGVTSYGDAFCEEYAVDTRVDAYAEFLEGETDGAAGAGAVPSEGSVDEGGPARQWEGEPNDTKQQAEQVEGPRQLRGTLGRWGDLDWYRFVLPRQATLRVDTAVPGEVDLDLALYGADGHRLISSENDVGQPEVLEFINGWSRSRVLYLKVYGYAGSYSATSSYKVHLRW